MTMVRLLRWVAWGLPYVALIVLALFYLRLQRAYREKQYDLGIQRVTQASSMKRVYEERLKRKPQFNTLTETDRRTSIPSLISLQNTQDVRARRQQLLTLVWGAPALPDRLPDKVEVGIADKDFEGFSTVRSIDRLTVRMPHGVESVMYLFHPVKPNQRALIYHDGHSMDFAANGRIIRFFVDRGYAVLAVAMPLCAMNSRPVTTIEHLGVVTLEHHNQLELLDRPLQFFLEPVVRGVNYLQTRTSYRTIHMAGLSGGGWTTTVYAALDPRITLSYPVAGTMPLHLGSGDWIGDWADFEQHYPPLMQAANYMELYLLGATGAGRRQLQVLNKFDERFGGIRYRTYLKDVQRALANIGPGTFDVYLDDSHIQHHLSDQALAVIVRDIEQHTPGSPPR